MRGSTRAFATIEIEDVTLTASATTLHETFIEPKKGRSLWSDAMQRLFRHRMAVVSMVFIAILIVVAIFADYLNPYVLQGFGDVIEASNQPAYAYQELVDNNAKPMTESKSEALAGFIYDLGRGPAGPRPADADHVSVRASRWRWPSSRPVVSLVIGVVYGLVSGFAGGRVDELMMRIVDFLYGLPIIIVIILLQVYFKAVSRRGGDSVFIESLLNFNSAMGGMLFVFIAIGALNWIGMARIARGQALSYKQKEFVEAARAIGTSRWQIIMRHLLPNILGPCIVQETLQIPGYIALEAFLSFIGLGVDAPTPSWGIMINEGFQALRSNPHIVLVPATAFFLTVLSFNFLGDGLRDALDPRTRQ